MLKIFMTQGKKLLIYLILIQKLDLKLFTNQNKMRLREKDLKNINTLANDSEIAYSPCTSKSR